MTRPYYEHGSITIYQGDVLPVLRQLPDESVNCCVTSPPYWGLRDYGIPASVWGGDPECEHDWATETVEREMRLGLGIRDSVASTRGGAIKCAEVPNQKFERGFCLHCNAWLGCLGLEPTPELFVEHTVEVFREVRRVLRGDATLWLNIGDSYANDGKWGGETGGKAAYLDEGSRTRAGREKRKTGLKPKDLCGIPWMLAFALRTDGWYLRQDIIWHKPNPMPESVTDRCTKAHEYIFLMSKSQRYHYDMEAVKEPVTGGAHARGEGVNPKARYKMPDGWDTGAGGHGSFHRNGREKGKTPGKNSRIHVDRDPAHQLTAKPPRQNESFSAAVKSLVPDRNKRSVWTIATEAFPEAHFATFPTELIKPCILAGCPTGGTVLDPFAGSGTTMQVARDLSCKSVGIELNPEYIEIAKRRLQQDVIEFPEATA